MNAFLLFCVNRRDSFITHRAFCEALAEETARVTAAYKMNNANAGNISYPFMGTSLRSNMVQHFSSVFKPIPSSNGAMDQTRPGLSLWMDQESQTNQAMSNNLTELHQMGSSSIGTVYADPFSNPPHTDYQVNWAFGNKLSSTNAGELTSTTPPLTNLKEVGSPRLASAPSLYSTQHYHHQLPPAIMSATALLQKAAEIGATSTNPSFLESYGLKCNNNQIQDGNKYNDLFSPSLIPTNLGSDLDNSVRDLTTLNHLQMYPRKRPKTLNDDAEEGQTRDFLGVGVQTICPSSINGWI
uniref:BIRD-IDD transcription factor fourth C2HC zinc finger domain-containing protein n=1 Tax=Nelumbo nucifera TaxID=4432 RepID=A0A822XHV7_NELNU|nr:TPA_asm: hypothetical protein HUJ06_022537 [Nelumbo nucifera]